MTPSERYAHRVARRICVQCAAGLQPLDGVRCVECAAADRESPGKSARDARHRATPARKEYRAAYAVFAYASAVTAKICADSGCDNPATKFKRCATCRRKRAKWNAEYRARLSAAEGRAR